MGVKKRLFKIGGCAGGLIIPKPLLELLDLRPGDQVELDLEKNGETAIILRPIRNNDKPLKGGRPLQPGSSRRGS